MWKVVVDYKKVEWKNNGGHLVVMTIIVSQQKKWQADENCLDINFILKKWILSNNNWITNKIFAYNKNNLGL